MDFQSPPITPRFKAPPRAPQFELPEPEMREHKKLFPDRPDALTAEGVPAALRSSKRPLISYDEETETILERLKALGTWGNDKAMRLWLAMKVTTPLPQLFAANSKKDRAETIIKAAAIGDITLEQAKAYMSLVAKGAEIIYRQMSIEEYEALSEKVRELVSEHEQQRQQAIAGTGNRTITPMAWGRHRRK